MPSSTYLSRYTSASSHCLIEASFTAQRLDQKPVAAYVRDHTLHATLEAFTADAAAQLSAETTAGAEIPFELVETEGRRGAVPLYCYLAGRWCVSERVVEQVVERACYELPVDRDEDGFCGPAERQSDLTKK